MRQYGEVPPWLAAVNTPAVSATSGLGTGGGAAVQTQGSSGFGSVDVFAGVGVAASGSVTVVFPNGNPPPGLFWGADEAFGAISVDNSTPGQFVVSWTAAKMIPRSQRYLLRYEWSVSQ